jgi:pantothenate kinase
MEDTYKALAERIRSKWAQSKALGHARLIIAVAGPPGSGKTTITANVVKHVSMLDDAPSIVSIPADGFHLPRKTLLTLPNAPEAMARRGAPWTFDGVAAADLARRLRAHAGREAVYAPTFDHAVKDPVQGGLSVPPETEVCIFEGNYLLSDEEPWRSIGDMADDRWLVRVEADVAKRRLAARHLRAGIETTMEDAVTRAESNDMVNGEYVMARSFGRYDVLVDSVEEERELRGGSQMTR